MSKINTKIHWSAVVCGSLRWSAVTRQTPFWVSRHFGPRTLRTQDISALVPKYPDTLAPVWWCQNFLSPKCPGSEVSWHHTLEQTD